MRDTRDTANTGQRDGGPFTGERNHKEGGRAFHRGLRQKREGRHFTGDRKHR